MHDIESPQEEKLPYTLDETEILQLLIEQMKPDVIMYESLGTAVYDAQLKDWLIKGSLVDLCDLTDFDCLQGVFLLKSILNAYPNFMKFLLALNIDIIGLTPMPSDYSKSLLEKNIPIGNLTPGDLGMYSQLGLGIWNEIQLKEILKRKELNEKIFASIGYSHAIGVTDSHEFRNKVETNGGAIVITKPLSAL